MAEKKGNSHYVVGRIDDSANRIGEVGEYGVIRGAAANSKPFDEWRMFCEQALYKSYWFAYRNGPRQDSKDSSRQYPVIELLKRTEKKKEAVEWLENRYTFDEKF